MIGCRLETRHDKLNRIEDDPIRVQLVRVADLFAARLRPVATNYQPNQVIFTVRRLRGQQDPPLFSAHCGEATTKIWRLDTQ
jgi:hypothetical protein